MRYTVESCAALLVLLVVSFVANGAHAQNCRSGDIEIERTATTLRCRTLTWWDAPVPGSVGDQLLKNYKGFRKLYRLYNGQNVDDKRVEDFLSVVGIQDRDKTYSLEELWHAHEGVLRCRSMRDGCDTRDLNLAAVDHYLNMRREGLQHGDISIRDAPGEYYDLKKAAFAVGQERRMQETPNPVSAPDRDVVEWGKRGVEDGLRDYQRVNHVEPKNGNRLSQMRKEWILGKYSGVRPGG